MQRRVLRLVALLLGALALTVAIALTSETFLRLAAARVAPLTGGRVVVEGVHGSLLGPLSAERVVITSRKGARTTALRGELEPRWRSLWRGALVIERVAIAELRVIPSGERDEPPEVPESLALPVALEIERVEIERLMVAERTQLRAIRGSLALGRGAHRARLTQLFSPWGDFSGNARVETAPPFALSGELAYARAELPESRAKATLGGTLVAGKLTLAGTLGGAPVSGNGRFSSFARPWLERLQLRGEHVDSAAFVRSPSAPHADLALVIDVRGAADAIAVGSAEARNAKPGPLSARALPVTTLQTQLRLADGALHFSGIAADLGPAGRAGGEGRVEDGALHLDLIARELDLRALHAALRPTRLAGEIDARIAASRLESTLALREANREIRGRIVREGQAVRAKDVRIAIGRGEISGSAEWDGASRFAVDARFAAFDPAALGDFPAASLSGEVDAAGELGEVWSARIDYALRGSRFRGRALEGRGELTLAESRVSNADAELRLGGNRLRAKGAFGAPGDALAVTLDAPDLSALGGDFSGALALDAKLTGTLRQPGGELSATAHRIVLPAALAVEALEARARIGATGARELDAALRASGVSLAGVALDDAAVDAKGTLAAHELRVAASGSELSLEGLLAGGWDGAWSGRAQSLATSGSFPAHLIEAAPLRYAPPANLELGPARVTALGGELAISSFRLERGRIETAGAALDLSLAEALRAAGRDASVAGDLRLRGVWVVPLDPAQLGQVRLELASGDAALAGAPLGIRALTIDAALGESVARISASVSGERLGHADLRADLSAAPGRALLSRSSALNARLGAEVDSLRALGGLLGISARVEGRGSLAITATGSAGDPQLRGAISADSLRFDWPSAGVALRDGKLAAELTPDLLRVETLDFAAAKGTLRASGEIPLDGSASRLAWEADGLRVLDRPDRNLEVSGRGDARLAGGRLALRGALRADRGYLEVPRITQSKLGDDVIVLGRQRPENGPRASTRLDLDLELDAGKRLRIVGAGLDTFLRGKLHVKTLPNGELVAFGEIDATNGTYRAFGQKLEIERGSLIFNGAIDDPALDVLALRKNQPVEAGVALTGTLKQPLAQLTSDPPVPDSEKLSWLVLGHDVSDASAADTALLQAAAATIFSGDGGMPIGQRIAQGIGLDEISLKSTGERGSEEATDRAVALGKRLTDKIYLEYEYGLEAASHLVRLHYALTRALSVRAETTGDTSNVGVNYRKSWD